MTSLATLGRTVALVATCWVLLIVAAPHAMADAAGPTDYRTDIVSIEPATPSIELEMIGGDSFMRLEQLEPVEVVIIGYRGEQYLRFDADGTVVENRRSPSTWLNQDRYDSDVELPSFVDYQAPPQWSVVAEGGAYAWHDHRSHWMSRTRPPGTEAGDQVLEATVPILVDGETVTITVASYLLEDPPWWPSALGVVLSGVLAAAGLRGGRLPLAVVGVLTSGAALLLGAVAFRSVPPETEPERLLWLLPLVGLLAALALVVVRNRLATTVYLDGLSVVTGATLVAWTVTRADALTRALIPSDAPASVDRLVIAGAIVAGLVLAARGLYGLVRPERLIEPT